MTTGTRISHYELLDSIGRDGAGELYRAHDIRLDRDVAVKLLRQEEMSRPDAVERFRREAHIASLVTHPNICSVHESGEEDGRPFFVCELLEGKALDEAMAEAPLPPDRLLDIGIQLCDALAAAHQRKIIHGNLKPSNVFITNDGYAKLLELGAVSATQPAEAGGASLDDQHRDVSALGALLYEMATGSPPVRSHRLDSGLPATLRRIIERALQKEPVRGYQSAAELRDDLRRARRSLDASPQLFSRLRSHRRLRIAAATAVALSVLLAVALSARWWFALRPNRLVERSAVLVATIANETADSDFDETLRQAVIVYLAQSPYLDLVSDERIGATLQLMGRERDARMNHDVAAEVCQRLGLQSMLEGRVSAVARSTVVALIATDCSTGATVAREHIEVARKEDVLRATGQLTAAIRKSLGESPASLTRHNVPIEEATTPSMEALKAYTEAVRRRAAGGETDAVKLLEQAIAIDPEFALAYTTLSSVFGGFGETGPSEKYARLAFEHRSRVSERERLFITYQYHDRVTGDQLKAREALEVWKATYPRDYRPANALAVLLNRLGDYTGAAREAAEAMRRNPTHAFPRSNLAYAHRGAGRFAEARTAIEEALARNLETVPMRRLLYQLAELAGDEATVQRQIDWAASQTRGFDITGARAQVAVYRGRMADARRLYAATIAAATERGFPQIASGYASQAALAEALYGYTQEAIVQAHTVLKTATTYEPQLRAATALAIAGAPDDAGAVVRRLQLVRPEDTLLHGAYLPIAETALLLARRQLDAAVEQLRGASRYETGTVAALMPIYLRAAAQSRAGAAQEAAREYRALVAHRGVDPFSPLVPLSQLGIARALAHAGAHDECHAAYEDLFRTWAAADPDLAMLRQAREEVARLPPRP